MPPLTVDYGNGAQPVDNVDTVFSRSAEPKGNKVETGGNVENIVVAPSALAPPYRLGGATTGGARHIVSLNGAIVCTVPKPFAAFALAALNSYPHRYRSVW